MIAGQPKKSEDTINLVVMT